jgi:hypothetical protein
VRGPTWAASVFDSLGRNHGRNLVKGLIFIIVNAADRTVTVGVRVALVAERERVFSHNSARLSSIRYNSTQLLRVVPVTPVRARTMQCLWPISIALASQPSHHLSADHRAHLAVRSALRVGQRQVGHRLRCRWRGRKLLQA